MTVQDWLKGQLANYGMFPDQADVVIERVKASIGAGGMHWSDQKESYSGVIYSALMRTAASYAIDYIDETIPKAWFRPVFARLAGRE